MEEAIPGVKRKMNEQIINILKEDLKYNAKEVIKHKEAFEQTGSKRQRDKKMKHFHRKYYIVGLLRKLGCEICSECGGVKRK